MLRLSENNNSFYYYPRFPEKKDWELKNSINNAYHFTSKLVSGYVHALNFLSYKRLLLFQSRCKTDNSKDDLMGKIYLKSESGGQ